MPWILGSGHEHNSIGCQHQVLCSTDFIGSRVPPLKLDSSQGSQAKQLARG